MFGNLVRAAIPPEDEALRAPLKAWLAAHLPPLPLGARARSWMGLVDGL